MKKPQPRPSGNPYDVAVRLLGLRAHSTAELGRKLGRRGYEDAAIAEVLERLASHGYLDDARFARALVEHRAGSRGRAAIAAELGAKGVSRDVRDAAVAELDPEDQVVAATRFAARWASRSGGSLRVLLDAAGPRLARRGYSTHVVVEACRRALREALVS